MRYKSGVNFDSVEPPVFYALGFAEAVYTRHGAQMVVTSLNDSHAARPESLHHGKGTGRGFAGDLRTKNIAWGTVAVIYAEIRAHLFAWGFDVVLHEDRFDAEGKQVEWQHIHVEYDPKPTRDNWKKEAL